MKKLVPFILSLVLVFSLSACGNTEQQTERTSAPQERESSLYTEGSDQDTEETVPANTESDLESEEQGESAGTDILIAYFSRADENYGVGVIEKGNTEIIAEMIAEETGGELFHIERSTPYPADYDECTDEAKKEQEENARPELASELESIEAYNTIFIGYPIWLAYHNLIQCTQA